MAFLNIMNSAGIEIGFVMLLVLMIYPLGKYAFCGGEEALNPPEFMDPFSNQKKYTTLLNGVRDKLAEYQNLIQQQAVTQAPDDATEEVERQDPILMAAFLQQ